jgi:alpha-beta hydrolase superfamily lysophospholipase
VIHAAGTLTGAGAGAVGIFWQSWAPEEGAARGVVVIVHGFGEHSGRYEHVARRLVAEGYVTYALDHRGHGHSQGTRAVIDRLADAVSDIDQLLVLAGDAHPGLPVFMLGHSMGGLLAVQYALEHQDRLAGLVLSGALAALDAAPAPSRLIARMLSAVAPRAGLIALDASLVSRDPQVVAAYRADPMVHHGKLPARTVAELIAAGQRFPERVAEIRVPTLIMYGGDDRLCPPSGSVMLGERIGAADITVIPYEGLYHEILNEPEQETVLRDMCGWLDAHVGAGVASPR